MAAINDLISQIQDAELRDRIQREVNKLSKQKKLGLVFEEHLPECTPLYDMPIKKGCNVMRRDNKEDKSIYVILKIEEGTAICSKRDQHDEVVHFALTDIVRIAEFGEPIYPYLKPLDSVCNAPDSKLWHILIESDNYHALQLLEYFYAGQVDCIYIDPPYNSGAKDWKYNNDYVDGADLYRHSKWLSMIQKRLYIAKRLLKMESSVLIVTIDEKEYLHLGCLLEEMFPHANIQMITTVISRNGTSRENEFSRVEEYIFICRFGNMGVTRSNDNMLSEGTDGVISRVWFNFMRTSTPRSKTKGQFFPIYIDANSKKIVSIGEPLAPNEVAANIISPEGQIAVFPIKDDGSEATWGAIPETTKELLKNGFLRVGTYDKKTNRWNIQYVRQGDQKRIVSGEILVTGIAEDGSKILEPVDATQRTVFPKTVWNRKSHDATEHGTRLLKQFMPDGRFSYPKSLYAVRDTIRFFVSDKPDALILDFFAGSGTTLHAVNLLNASDNGQRRCILVTNNELSEEEAKRLRAMNFCEGDEEWNKLGIARYVTWPRTVCSIEGHDINGKPVKGNYLETEMPIADGFKTNAAFFQLGFLDKTTIALGMNFKEMLPIFWMKSGAIGACPTIENEMIPTMLILPENRFAILMNENAYAEFREKLKQYPEIQTVFLATDYDVHYRTMVKDLNVENTYQLFRDYLDHFRLNRGRN
ncbi:site-specific DNA-methyltransferase [Allofournierella sp. CML151]|uniref:site-specific DNA-methyltransferase n=1 Tax=Allofournierella sp. CML151 TaxID=2998082 RepID=UPI0022EB0395|nr:DNA methyltransferase [Fournierella sp. CML151]